MGRRKIEIQPITHERNRSVTFLKRKNGLFKKAYELGVLCSVDVAVIIFEERPNGHVKLHQYCSTDVHDIVQRHLHHDGERDTLGTADFSNNAGGIRTDDAGDGDKDEDGDEDGDVEIPAISTRGVKRNGEGKVRPQSSGSGAGDALDRMHIPRTVSYHHQPVPPDHDHQHPTSSDRLSPYAHPAPLHPISHHPHPRMDQPHYQSHQPNKKQRLDIYPPNYPQPTHSPVESLHQRSTSTGSYTYPAPGVAPPQAPSQPQAWFDSLVGISTSSQQSHRASSSSHHPHQHPHPHPHQQQHPHAQPKSSGAYPGTGGGGGPTGGGYGMHDPSTLFSPFVPQPAPSSHPHPHSHHHQHPQTDFSIPAGGGGSRGRAESTATSPASAWPTSTPGGTGSSPGAAAFGARRDTVGIKAEDGGPAGKLPRPGGDGSPPGSSSGGA